MLQVNKAPYDEDKSVSLVGRSCIDFTNGQHLQKNEQTSGLLHKLGDMALAHGGCGYMRSKDTRHVLRELLGRQLVCRTYSYRNWIWTLALEEYADTAVYLLQSERGVSFEAPNTSDPDGIMRILMEFERRVQGHK